MVNKEEKEEEEEAEEDAIASGERANNTIGYRVVYKSDLTYTTRSSDCLFSAAAVTVQQQQQFCLYPCRHGRAVPRHLTRRSTRVYSPKAAAEQQQQQHKHTESLIAFPRLRLAFSLVLSSAFIAQRSLYPRAKDSCYFPSFYFYVEEITKYREIKSSSAVV